MKIGLSLVLVAGLVFYSALARAKEKQPVVTETVEQATSKFLEATSGKMYSLDSKTEIVFKTPKGERKGQLADLKLGTRVELQMQPSKRALMRVLILPATVKKP